MSAPKFSLNKSALKLVKKIVEDPQKYSVSVEASGCGATLIDAGLSSKDGGFLAGKIVSEISLAGFGKASIMPISYGSLVLPSVFVTTDLPGLSILGSQFAGWQVKSDGFSAFASGPARALAIEPMDLFQKLGFKEESDVAVILLETETFPPEVTVRMIAERCGVSCEDLFVLLVSSNSLVGGILACSRVVEAGLRKLVEVGFDPLLVRYSCGYAPIVTVHPESARTTERAIDAIRSCGVTNYSVEFDDEQKLRTLVGQVHTSGVKMLEEAKRLAGKNPLYKDFFEETGIDLSKVETNSVTPALVTVSNLKTGNSFSAGEFDLECIKGSLGAI